MIIDSSKDYGTGEVIMTSDGTTSPKKVWQFLSENYGVTSKDGEIVHTPKSEYNGLKNPESWNFEPSRT